MSTPRPAVPYVLGAAHVAAFTWWFAAHRGSFFGGDSGQYLAIAEAIRSGTLWANPQNGKPLGYPSALALLGLLPGGSVVHALALNAACYLATLWLIGRLVRRLDGSPRAAWGAQLLFAMIPNTAAWANLVLSDTLATMLLAAIAWLTVAACSSDDRQRPARLAALGVVIGLSGMTRSEYALLAPLVGILVAIDAVRRRWPARRAAARLLIVWVAALPWLVIQPLAGRLHGAAAAFPPQQSGALQLWIGRYDLEFTQLRLFRYTDLIRLVAGPPPADPRPLHARLDALRLAPDGSDPIPDAVLATAYGDLIRLSELVTSRGLNAGAAYRAMAARWVAQRPWEFLSRAGRRFVLYATAAEREWPRTHPAHRLYTVVLRPVAIFGYALWGLLLAARRGRARWAMLVCGLFALYPILVHSCFIFEQRFSYPAVPLLCVVLGCAADTIRPRP